MAHSDTLIFLTNISWIFLLFLFCYFFFVLFFLPTFYKKVRARSLVRNNQQRVVLILLANSVVGSLLLVKELAAAYVLDLKYLVSSTVLSFSASSFLFEFKPMEIVKANDVSFSANFYLGTLSFDNTQKLISCFDKFNK